MNTNRISCINLRSRSWLVVFAIMTSLFLLSTAQAEDLVGDWSVELDSGLPAWMRVIEEGGQPQVYIRLYIGPTGPYKAEQVDGRLKFEIRRNPKKKNGQASITKVDVGRKNGKLDGILERQLANETSQHDAFTGKKVPPMPASAPDLSKVRFGHPILLFNGKDMTSCDRFAPITQPRI